MKSSKTKNAPPSTTAPGVLLGQSGLVAPQRNVGFATEPRTPHVGTRRLITDDSESHIAIFAPTGAGKGRNVLIPTLLSTTSSVIALDVKGELARSTADFRRRVLRQQVHLLDPWHLVTTKPDSFNPLDIIHSNGFGLPDDCYAVANLLADPSRPSKEAYWDDCSQSVIAGIIAHVLTSAAVEERNLGAVWRLTHGADVVYELAVLLDATTDMHPWAKAQIAKLLQLNADTTRSCLLSVIGQHMRLFGSEAVQQAVATTSFDLNGLRAGAPMTIYLVVPPSKLISHGGLLRIWLSALMAVIGERTAQPEHPTLMMLDEVAQLGRMEQVIQAVTLMRGYGLRCMLMLQSYAQLKQHYPQDHEVLLENCGIIGTFGHTAFSMSAQMSTILGDISAEALFGMGPGALALRRPGSTTVIVDRVDYLTDPRFEGRFPAVRKGRSN